jgi:hypothetical protein
MIGLGEKEDDKNGDDPAQLQIKVEQGHAEKVDRFVENGEEWIIHHDDPQDKEDHP